MKLNISPIIAWIINDLSVYISVSVHIITIESKTMSVENIDGPDNCIIATTLSIIDAMLLI